MSFSFEAMLIPCGGTALVVLIYIWLAWHVLRSASANAANVAIAIGDESSKKENGGLSKDDIQKLPTFICNCHHHEKQSDGDDERIEKQSDGDERNEKQSDGNGEDKFAEELSICEDLDCCVCLEEFQDGDKCLLMPTCKHCFHVECAGAWLTKRPICPLCRAAALPKHDEKDEQHCSTSNDYIPHSTVIDISS